MNAYEMTTVKAYIDLLDNDLSDKEKSVKKSIQKFIHKARKARENANILEILLA